MKKINLISPNLDLPEPLQLFLDSCLWEKGIRNIPQDLHDQMIRDLAVRLETWLLQEAAGHLEEKDIKDFDALMGEEPTKEKVQMFLQDHIPNLDAIFENSMLMFKDTYLQV